MHSCSVAIKTFLKFEQKANQYRKNKQFENLFDKILVYFISHDQKNVHFYEHYALIEKKNERIIVITLSISTLCTKK